MVGLMNIEILSIGNELLSGKTLNTNSAVISKKLFDQGYRVRKQRVVKDTIEDITKAFKDIFLDPSLLICTGGLGPTIDDITKNAIAAFFDVEFEVNKEVLSDLKNRFKDNHTLESQATLIKNAKIIPNKIGTASGMIYKFDRGTVLFLPGVPFEMEAMLDSVLEHIGLAYPLANIPTVKNINLCLIEEPEVDPVIRKIAEKHKEVEYGIYPHFGGISLQLIADSEKKLTPVLDEIIKAFPDRFYFSKNNCIEEAVHNLFIEKKLTLSFAESCSGGALASSITKQAGSSQYFLGSMVTYSNEMKRDILGVMQKTLDTYGAVSKETVHQMLEGLFKNSKADYAIAVSGIAGPSGAMEGKPVGTVYVGIAKRNEPFEIGKIFGRGDRESVIEYTVKMALGMLYRRVKYEIRAFDG